MSKYPIYRTNEPRQHPSECVSSKMTEEDMIRVFGGVFKPATDFDGRALNTKVFAPFKTKAEKAEKPKEATRKGKFRKFPNVDREFISFELACGKTYAQIAKENGMSTNSLYHRAEVLGLYKPTERIRGAGKEAQPSRKSYAEGVRSDGTK